MRRLRLLGPDDVRAAARALGEVAAAGGVALVPTETYYGLAADPASPEGVDRVYRLKDRPGGMPLPVLCADWGQVESLVEVPAPYRVRLSRSWPGPLTVVLPARRPLPASPGGTLAVRIPGHDLLRALLYLVGPLTGTSANRHGAPPAREVGPAVAGLAGEPELVLDGGLTPGGPPSTLVDLTGAVPRVLRPGPVGWS